MNLLEKEENPSMGKKRVLKRRDEVELEERRKYWQSIYSC
jgi:hypothetical protein